MLAEVSEGAVRHEGQAPVGIDFGLKAASVLPMVKSYAPPRALARNLKRRRRLSQEFSRKKRRAAATGRRRGCASPGCTGGLGTVRDFIDRYTKKMIL